MADKVSTIFEGFNVPLSLTTNSFWLSVRESAKLVNIVAVPIAPKKAEPILLTFKLNNFSPQILHTSYQLYASGELLAEGDTTIPSASSETHQYAYENPFQIGTQLNFLIKCQSDHGNYEKLISLPCYSPQIWTSFITFASFSTSIMSSMSNMLYYQTNFGNDVGPNTGVIASIVLIALLLFAELYPPLVHDKTLAILGRLRIKLSTLTWILFVVFMGMVYTRVVMAILSADTY